MKKIAPKLLILLVIVVSIFLFHHFNLASYLSLEYIKANQERFAEYYALNRLSTLSIFTAIYILVTALSLPGAAVLTLVAGGLFGLLTGVVLVSFASTIGATLAFLSSRYLFRDYIQNKFSKYLVPINEGMRKNGIFYLLTLRLIPVFPFFIINLVMGLTKIKTFSYFIVSQIGMLAGTFVYVNAGLQLSKIESLKGILSLNLIISLSLLGIFPLLAKKLVEFFETRKVYAGYKKPKTFDYNMIAIGGGAAGLVTSYIGSAVKAKVALIEKDKMGGDCLNTGCVPSKAIIKSAKIAHQIKKSNEFGIEIGEHSINFKQVMGRVHNIIDEIEPHDSIERYTELGVDCITGSAKILSPWEVEVNGKVITTKNITIATGARPLVPELEGIEKVKPLTSENLWELSELPNKMIIIGGGPIGCEMAQSFNRLGSQVTQVVRGDRLMKIEDVEVSEFIEGRFQDEGIRILKDTTIVKIENENGVKSLTIARNGVNESIEFDEILFAVGRVANTSELGLEDLGIELRKDKTIVSNDYLQTKYPNIFACGDVTGPYQLTHVASHQAWYCAVNGLFGILKKFKVDYSVIPWATYSDPEVATVGLNEQRAQKENIEYELTTYDISDLDRAITDGENHGFIRVLTKPGSDKVLGATIVSNHASDMLIEFVAAMRHGFGLNKILGTIHVYPSMGEANKYVAGNWKKKQTSDKVFNLLEIFHKAMR